MSNSILDGQKPNHLIPDAVSIIQLLNIKDAPRRLQIKTRCAKLAK
ncbi:hypothetical protein [Yoonia sp. MH D7]